MKESGERAKKGPPFLGVTRERTALSLIKAILYEDINSNHHRGLAFKKHRNAKEEKPADGTYQVLAIHRLELVDRLADPTERAGGLAK